MDGRAVQEMKARTYSSGSAQISRGIGAAIARHRKQRRRTPVAVTAQQEEADAAAIEAFIAANGVKKIEAKEADGAADLNWRGFAGFGGENVLDSKTFSREFTVNAPEKVWETARPVPDRGFAPSTRKSRRAI